MSDAPRPRWSVMIPTYNCAKYLRETLQSVLRAGVPADEMQIEVVDDVSTQDDPEAVVREVGQERVAFWRQPANVGVARNFNACVARSRGELVHILHGDDMAEPELYARVGAEASAHPDVAFFATKTHTITEASELAGESPSVPSLTTPGRDVSPFLTENPFRTPGIVIRRSFYEQHGGFAESLRHTADWEMWNRAIALGGGLFIDEKLARYRWFAANDSSRLMRTGDNLRDYLALIPFFKQYRGWNLAAFYAAVQRYAQDQATHFRLSGVPEAEAANLALARELGVRIAMAGAVKGAVR